MNKKYQVLLLAVAIIVVVFAGMQLKAKTYEVKYDNAIVQRDVKSVSLTYELKGTNGMKFQSVKGNNLVDLINEYKIKSYILKVNDDKYDLLDYDVNSMDLTLGEETIIDISITSNNELTDTQIFSLTDGLFEIVGPTYKTNKVATKVATTPYDCRQGGVIYSESVGEFQEMNLFTGDIYVNELVTQALADNGSAKVNALGYNPNDGYIYGIDNVNDELLKIGADGVSFYPLINGPKEDIEGGVIDVIGNTLVVVYPYTGRNAYGYISLEPSNIGEFVEVEDTDGRNVKFVGDLYYNETDDEFYGIEISSTDIMKANFDRDNLTIGTTKIRETGFNANISGAFGFNDDSMYIYDTSGKVYKYNIITEEIDFIGDTTSAGGDATYCTESIGFDYGDAPDSYKTLKASDGPRHVVVNSESYLGDGISLENDAPATLDFTTDTFDDGVITDGLVDEPEDGSNPITVSASRDGYISIWLDLNGDGIFDDSTENIIDPVFIEAGSTEIDLGDLNFDDSLTEIPLRIRYMRADSLSEAQTYISTPTSIASNGEVEDHLIPVKEEASLVTTKEVTDSTNGNNDGLAQLGEQLHYTIRVENPSMDSAAEDVVLQDTIPDQLDVTQISNLKVSTTPDGPNLISPSNGITSTISGNTITINMDSFEAEGVYYIQYDILVRNDLTKVEPITNVVTTEDSTKTYPEAEATIEMSATTDYIVNKANINNEDELASAGEILEYNIEATNNGTLNLENVKITDSLSDVNLENFQVISVKKGDTVLEENVDYTVSGNTVNINYLGIGETVTVKISATVKDPLQDPNVLNVANQLKYVQT